MVHFDRMLAGYTGYLVADAHAVYDHVYRGGDVIEVACWAHARRHFFKALESEPERAREALGAHRRAVRIERQITEAPTRKREVVRQRESRPVVDRLFAWCRGEATRALDETPLAKGIGYALDQRAALARFLEDARLPVHNNGSENALRREVVGRKNWLFVGKDDAGEVNAAFVSLLASCELHGIEPWGCLREMFCLMPSWPRSRALELAPVNWRQTLARPEVQQRLEANIYRRASLAPFAASLAPADAAR